MDLVDNQKEIVIKEWESESVENGLEKYLGYPSILKAVEDTELTSQVEALCRMLNKESVFLSGVAGAGKSFVINKFVRIMQDYFINQGVDPVDIDKKIVVTGATGSAAANIGGKTIHSALGLGICSTPIDPKQLLKRPYQKEIKLSPGFYSAYHALKPLEVLIIDEVSMLDSVFIDNIDVVLKTAKRSKEPFGGVTMVFVGDFMQLPPVRKEDVGFAFESEAWQELNPKLLFMSKSRRSQDNRLNVILNDMRNGVLSKETKQYIKEAKAREGQESYVRLFTKNSDVDSYNTKKLLEIKEPSFQYDAFIEPFFTNSLKSPNNNSKTIINGKAKALKQLGLVDNKGNKKILELKKGATVLITRNFFATDKKTKFLSQVVNGDVGVITEISKNVVTVKLNRNNVEVNIPHINSEQEFGVPYKINNDTEIIRDVFRIRYMPLKLCFATTVHKSQGQTLDGVVVDLSQCFTPGLGYVAISRVANLDNLSISKITRSSFDRDKKCADMSKKIEIEAKKNKDNFKSDIDKYEIILSTPDFLKVIWV